MEKEKNTPLGTGVLIGNTFYVCSSLGELMDPKAREVQYMNDQRRLDDHLKRQQEALQRKGKKQK
ncbi:MAG: hypothetical protein IT284_02300 [Bacteroidetes bacterium]|nr:hypothetical protein [Bacteroidota bacterium]